MTPRKNLILAVVLAGVAFVGIRIAPLVIELPIRFDWSLDHVPTPQAEQIAQDPFEELGALADVARAQARAEDGLFALAGVTGTGVGWTESGAPAVKVFVEPGTAPALPVRIEDFPVVTHEAGPFDALAGQEAPAAPGAAQEADIRDLRVSAAPASDGQLPNTRFERPVPMGVSTGHLNSTAGTIGAVVTDGRQTYALSNWHVYVPGGRARVGDVLLQPGPYDGGLAPGDVIGTLADFEPVKLSLFANNRIDAAIALTDQVAPRTPSDGYGSPRSETMAAKPGLAVKKYGRTTGFTVGRVDAVNASINVNYGSAGSQVARFNGQVVLCCDMSQGGDSGSLIVAHDVDDEGNPGPNDRRPVALLFAGDRMRTIANPIDLVLDRFGVTIVGDEDAGR
ncbi:MAG: hypothetical protein R3266_01470 [Gemmatimonadota bacterium]|nr:hypothetical protein [Gemmatimonadota bacterium]